MEERWGGKERRKVGVKEGASMKERKVEEGDERERLTGNN